MMPVMHKRRARMAIAQVAIAGVLGVLILTPKMDGDRADTPEVGIATPAIAVAGASRLIHPTSGQRK